VVQRTNTAMGSWRVLLHRLEHRCDIEVDRWRIRDEVAAYLGEGVGVGFYRTSSYSRGVSTSKSESGSALCQDLADRRPYLVR